MLKKVLPLLLSLTLMITGVAPVFAETSEMPEEPVTQETAETAEETVPEVIKTPENIETPAEETVETPNETSVEEPEEIAPSEVVTAEKTVSEPKAAAEISEPKAAEIPVVTSFNVRDNGFRTMRVSWKAENADTVEIRTKAPSIQAKTITLDASKGYTEFNNILVWVKYDVKITPIKDGIKGESKMLSVDVTSDYKPAKVQVISNTKAIGYSNEGLNLKVIAKNGTTIPANKYYVKRAVNEKLGTNTGKIVFDYEYRSLPELNFTYNAIPYKPRSISVLETTKNSFRFCVNMDKLGKDYDYCEVVYSLRKDMKNAKTAKLANSLSYKTQIKGLKQNTLYYVKAAYVKKVGNKYYRSEYIKRTFRTPGGKPYPTKASKTTRNLLYHLRKNNKSFTYTFPYPVASNDAHTYAYEVQENFPQYDKFDYTIVVKDGNATKINYRYNKTKAVKANRVRAKVDDIVKYANRRKNVRDKVKYVNYRLKKMCYYDDAACRTSVGHEESYEAYGCLVRGKAVCSGYARAFDAVMKEMNITSSIVRTRNHAWNKVRIGNTWYHVDVTWNDCLNNNSCLLIRIHPLM